MKIIATPKEYTPAHTPVIYTIAEVDPSKMIEVAIMGTGGCTLGIKHFRGESQYAVNVGGYASKELEAQPIYAQSTGFYMLPNRTTAVSIAVKSSPLNSQTTSTLATTLIAASEQTAEMTQLAKNRKKTTITEADIDEISFIAPQKLVAAIVTLTGKNGVKKIAFAEEIGGGVGKLTGFRCMSGICSFIVNLGNIAERAGVQKLNGYSRMNVEIKMMPNSTSGKQIDLEAIVASVNTIAKREYIVTQSNPKTVRLCWLNRQAGVDYYSFTGERTQRVVVDKSRAYTSQGYKTYSSQAETIELLQSEYEPEQTIEWLSDIVGSKKVWRIDGTIFRPVDVVSSSVQTKGNGPTSISIMVREVEKKEF